MHGINLIVSMVALGLTAGVLGGLFGIGGGLIMVPALVLLFGLDIKTSTGTSLMAQLLPVGLLGVWEYWRRGQVQVQSGLWIAIGLLLGVFVGAMLTRYIPPINMRRFYGVFIICVGIYFLFWDSSKLANRVKSPTTPPPAASSESP